MHLRLILPLGVIGLLVLTSAMTTPRGAVPPGLRYTDTTFANGLRVIIAEDHSAPVFTTAITYNVGSRDERKGRTGFAHLFEHMMFKGSENVGQNEHPYLMFMNGGNMNGTTNNDRTLYYEVLPSNQVDLALFLEADRMRSLAITQANLDNQRSAVQEERRSRVDNQPYGRIGERMSELAYRTFSYGHSLIGSMEDLNAATVADVASFFRTYYAPNNAILSIVGDVSTRTTLAKVQKYFGAIPRQPAPPLVDVSEPQQTVERRDTIVDPLARLARLDIAYKVPPSTSPDYEALSVLGNILSGGRSARLDDMLMRQKQLATSVNASMQESRGPGLFTITAIATPTVPLADLEAAVYAEIERVKREPIAESELAKARMAVRQSYVGTLGSTLARAVTMGHDALFYNDPGRLAGTLERATRVTAEDVQRVARQYLTPELRTIIVTTPRDAARPTPKVGT